ncbi:MAG: hypothetical protein ACOH15_10960 [Acetobacterium sp.]
MNQNKRSKTMRAVGVHMTDKHISVISLKEELNIEREEKMRLEYRKDRLTKKLKLYRPIELEKRKMLIAELKIIQKHILEQAKVVFLLEKSMAIINESIDKLQGIEKKSCLSSSLCRKKFVRNIRRTWL